MESFEELMDIEEIKEENKPRTEISERDIERLLKLSVNFKTLYQKSTL